MDNLPLFLSLTFFIVFGVYIFWGLYVLFSNPKLNINRVFFALCIALGLWSLGFSLSTSANNIENCIFWRRVSALGFCSFYSILLHFFLIMTQSKILNKIWLMLLIYLPAAISVYVFSISSTISVPLYNVTYTLLGWITTSEKSFWDNFFNIYYSTYIIASLFILGIFRKKSPHKARKRQATLILVALLAAFFLGSVTDIIFHTCFNIQLPQIAPIIILIPISVLFAFMKNHGIMKVKSVKSFQLLMDRSNKSQIYIFISMALITGGFLNIISRNPITREVVLLTLFMVFIAIFIQVILHFNLSEDFKDIFILSIISILIPLITLQFLEYGAMTVWAFPFILIIIFTLFNNKKMLVVLSISIIATQFIVWLLVPNIAVTVEFADHLIRVILFIMAISLAFYVNRIHILRQKENSRQITVQKNIAEISSDFVTVDHSNIDEKINVMLKKSGEFFNIDRSFLFHFNDEKQTLRCCYSWSNNIGINELYALQNFPVFIYPWLKEQFNKYTLVNISDIDLLPVEFEHIKNTFLDKSIKSIILIPLSNDDKTPGFIGFSSKKSNSIWNEDHISTLKIMANLISNAFSKVKFEEIQEYMAYYDQLTSLANRTLFKDKLNYGINCACRNESSLAVMFLDLDSFKNINDTLGHENGDILLQKVGKRLKEMIRKTDTVARFSGDEFLILINNISDINDIEKVAKKLLSMFNKPFIINNQEFYITGSAGIAVYPIDGCDADTLIKNADIAMYTAKEHGKNQYQLCTTTMKNEIQNAMELTNSLYNVVDRNELVLYYQPQVNINSEKIVGLEALIRWNHPKLGLISPTTFIPLAEKTGLIDSIGEWVMKTACKQNKTWQDMGMPPLRMGVNLSFIQFKNQNLVKKVNSILEETGMKAEYLDLEITESTAVWETSKIIDTLKSLKSLGLYISIDDFGTEYSSLSRLKQLPFDRIKMDMQFVHGIDESEKDQAYANLIINLADSLGLTLIAEGVETDTQLQFLKDRGCDEVQGNYYYKPMPAEKIEQLFKNH